MLGKLFNIIKFKSSVSEEDKFTNQIENDSQIELSKTWSRTLNNYDSSLFEKVQNYDREMVYCSLTYAIGKSFYFTIKDLFQLKLEPGERKKIKGLFGIVKRLETIPDHIKIILTDPSCDHTFTLLSTFGSTFNLGDILNIASFEVELKSIVTGFCDKSTQILGFNNVTKVFEEDNSLLGTGDVHIVTELRLWFAKEVMRSSFKDIKSDNVFKSIACKILFYKKVKDFINLVIVDGNEYNPKTSCLRENLSKKDLAKVKENFHNLIKLNVDINMEEVLMDKMCLFVQISSNSLTSISKEIRFKLKEKKDTFVFYNLYHSLSDAKNDDVKYLSLIVGPSCYSFMRLACCDVNRYLLEGLNKKINASFVAIKVKQLCDEVNRFKRKSFDYLQSTPSKKFKHDADDVNEKSTQVIQVLDKQDSLSSIYQNFEEGELKEEEEEEEEEEEFIDLWIEEELDEFESIKSNESSISTIIYSISEKSSTEDEQDDEVRQLSKINDKQDGLIKHYPYSLEALKSMDKCKLMEYKQLAIKSQHDATQNDQSSLNQLIEMIDQILDNPNSSSNQNSVG